MSTSSIAPVPPVPPNRFAGLRCEQLTLAEQETVISLAMAVLEARHQPGALVASPEDMRRYFALRSMDYKNEAFGVIFLDNRHRMLADEILFRGSLAGAAVHPRVVVQRALEVNAAAVIFWHNHPSGVAEPSRSDESITRSLRGVLGLVDVRVLDHVVVGAAETISLAERGLL
jgi:DNA repair protein RadC